jgi:hypothetical protein
LLSVSLAVCSALTACGADHAKQPALARGDAAGLRTLARRIAGEGACAQRRDIGLLRRRVIVLVDARRVPSALAGTLMHGVDSLVADTPLCVTAVPAPTPTPKKHDHGHEHHHGHDHGDGNKGGGGD